MTRSWALIVVIGTLLGGCSEPATGSPSGQAAASGRQVLGEPVVLVPGRHTLEPGVTYLAADFDPPFTVEPPVEWVATLHDGNRGRNVGELTFRLGDVGVHFDQPGISDVQGGEPVPAPETLEDFVAAFHTVPGLQLDVGDVTALGEVTVVRIDAILVVGGGGGGGWPAAIFGVDELCIGPDAVTRFYLVELSDRLFVAMPRGGNADLAEQPVCDLRNQARPDEWSSAVEALLATLEEPPAR
jgi:hypothetical protein